MKFYGVIVNDFMDSCEPGKWMHVTKKLKLRASGDGYHLLLIFDSIAQKQKVAIANVKLVVTDIGM
jgi:hypothetical protein